MNIERKQVLRYTFSFTIAVALLYWVLEDVSFKEWSAVFQTGEPIWIAVAFVCLLLGFWIRAYRWRLLLKAAGSSLSTSSSFWILMVGYLVNFAFPRAGELFRAGLLKRQYRIPLSKGFGTVISERILDIIAAFAFVGVSLLLEYVRLWSYLRTTLTQEIFSRALLYLSVAVLLLGVAYLILRYRYTTYLSRLGGFLSRLWKSIYSIWQLRSSWKLYTSTILIWGTYYLGNYFFMQAYVETKALPLQAGVLLIATSSLGMMLPVPGGIGTFHALAQKTFVWYGVEKTSALAVAFAIHFSFTIAVVVCGGIGLLLYIGQKKRR